MTYEVAQVEAVAASGFLSPLVLNKIKQPLPTTTWAYQKMYPVEKDYPLQWESEASVQAILGTIQSAPLADPSGSLPMHRAAQHGDLAVVQLLVERLPRRMLTVAPESAWFPLIVLADGKDLLGVIESLVDKFPEALTVKIDSEPLLPVNASTEGVSDGSRTSDPRALGGPDGSCDDD